MVHMVHMVHMAHMVHKAHRAECPCDIYSYVMEDLPYSSLPIYSLLSVQEGSLLIFKSSLSLLTLLHIIYIPPSLYLHMDLCPNWVLFLYILGYSSFLLSIIHLNISQLVRIVNSKLYRYSAYIY